jgi:hypothetical protein
MDADVADAFGQVDGRVHTRGEGRELVQDQQGVLAHSWLATEGAPLGTIGGPLGVPHRRRGGQQADRDGQPHLGGHQVPEELADGDASAGWAETEMQRHCQPDKQGKCCMALT